MSETNDDVYARIDKFHAHLDVCEQCERHPFDLCAEGARLLKEAALGPEGTEREDSLGNCVICGKEASVVYPLLPGSPAFCSEHHNAKDAGPYGCDFSGPDDFDIPVE